MWKKLENEINSFLDLMSLIQISGDFQIFHNIAIPEDGVSLPAEDNSSFHPLSWLHVKNIFPFKLQFTEHTDSLATSAVLFFLHVNNQSGNRIHQGGLSCTIGSKNTHNLPITDLYVEVVQSQGIFEKDHQSFNGKHLFHLRN